jgi:outer membrane protein assembly factor BamB
VTRAARILLPLAVVAAGCNTLRTTSRTDVTRYHALARAAVGPLETPAWSGTAAAANAAFVAWAPGGVLVAYSTMERVGNNLMARRAAVTRLVLHDPRTGAPRWEATPALFGQVTLASSQPALVLLHEAGLSAFDPATGRVLWERKVNALGLAVDSARNQLVVWSRAGAAEEPLLVAVDLGTGKDRWTASIPPGVPAARPQVEVIGDRVLAVGLRPALFLAETGALVSAPPVDLGAPVVTLKVGGALVVGDVRGRVVRFGRDGALAWTADAGARARYLAADGDRLLVATSGELHLLSLQTGREAWRARGEHAGAAAFSGAGVIWSTRPKLLLLETATGREVAAAPRSPVMALGGLPDQLLLGDDQVTVVGEMGVMAVSLGARRPPGTVLWRLDLRGVWSSRTAGLRWSGGALAAASTEYLADRAFVPPPAPLSPVKLENPWAERLDKDRSETGIMKMSSSERAGYARLAAGQAEANARLEQAAASLAMSMAMLSGWRSRLEAGKQLWLFAATQRQNALAQEATTLWLASVQGDYLVRPIAWELGQGVLVADLRTGRWRELVTGPGELAMDDFYLSHAPALLDPDTGDLVTLGRAGPATELVEFPNLRTTARTALAYRLGDPRSWSAPQEYPARSRVPPAVIALAPEAEQEFMVYRELVAYDRNQASRVVKGVTTKDELRRLLGVPGSTTTRNGVEVWAYSNTRPGGIELDLFEFDARGVVSKTYRIDTKTK